MFNATTVLNQLQHLMPLQQFDGFVGNVEFCVSGVVG